MKKNKTLGIILLVLFALSIVGGIANGTFANLGNENIGFYIGYFGAMAALLIFGIKNITKK